MSVFEVHGGPVDRRYLMKKTKDELATLVLDLLRQRCAVIEAAAQKADGEGYHCLADDIRNLKG